MKQFDVYENPQGEYEAVKIGWAWFAFWFGCIWAFVGKLWVIGGAYILIMITTIVVGSFIGGSVGNGVVMWFSIIFFIVFGFYGNKWRANNLISRGYKFKGNIVAKNKEGAIAQYVKNKEDK